MQVHTQECFVIRPEHRRHMEDKIADPAFPENYRKMCLLKIAIADGRKEEADNLTSCLLLDRQSRVYNEDEMQYLMIALWIANKFDSLSTILCERLRADIALTIEENRGEEQIHPAFFEFTASDRKHLILRFSRNLQSDPDIDFFVRYLLNTIPHFTAYLSSPGFVPGSCLVHASDIGSPNAISFSGKNIETLIPDPTYTGRNGYSALQTLFSERSVSWAEKKSVVFWRGSTTGLYSNAAQLPRVRLCLWAQTSRHASMLDVKISSIVQRSAEEEAEIIAMDILGSHIPEYYMDVPKYHIDIDGNTNSWPGLFIKLLSGGVVIKVASANGDKQWYYDKLIPFENFIPAKSDLSDLDEIIDWTLNNIDKAEIIAQRGKSLAVSMTLDSQFACSSKRIAGYISNSLL